MKITFLGATRTVTGSRHLIEANGSKVLLDCGLYQGRRSVAREVNREVACFPGNLDAVVLGHAHIDHSGNLPTLAGCGWEGPIHATSATADLCASMLMDSAYLQERDVEFVNKRLRRQGKPLVEPLHTKRDAARAISMFVGHDYHEPFEVADGVTVTYHDAGHILGAALTQVDVRENGRTTRIGYIVDLGRKKLPILRDPESVGDLDVLIMESTYGNRYHGGMESAAGKLADVVNRTAGRGGKVIIPAFAMERTQEMLYLLHELWRDGRIPELPIYVDSPLAINLTEVFDKHLDLVDADMQKRLRAGEDPFEFGRLQYTRTKRESMELNSLRMPAIIISASGMCEGGRILHHLRNNIENHRNTIMIVGFMAEHTLGRRIVDRKPVVRIFGDEFRLKADVAVMNVFSAHADRDGLVDYAKSAGRPKVAFLVHGEESQAQVLADVLRDEVGMSDVRIPSQADVFET